MQKTKLWQFLIFIISFCSLQAQTVLQTQNTHGGVDNDVAISITPTFDGNYMYTGTTNSIGAGGSDVLLNKMTPDGTLIWEKTFGGVDFDRANTIVQLPDGNYAVFGYTTSFGIGGNDFYLVKFDPNGDLIWQKTFGTTSSDRGVKMFLASDGGFVMCGQSFGTGGANNDYYIVKADANGNHLWTYTYDSGSYDGAVLGVETPQGDYIIGGITFGGGAKETYVKLDANGNEIWVKQFLGGTPNGATVSSDGNILFMGRSFSDDVFLRKIDTDGNTIWYKTYGGTSSEWGYQVDEMQDGGILLTAETVSYGEGASDAYFVRTDKEGNELWSQTYGGPSNDWINAISVINDNQYIGVGLTKSFGNANGTFDAYILRLSEIEPNATLSGKTYIDHNNNCVFDSGDDVLGNRLVIAEGVDGPYQTWSNAEGDYKLRLNTGDYLVSKDELDNWFVDSCALNPSAITMSLGNNGPVLFPANGNNDPCDFEISMIEGPNNDDECVGGGVYVTPCPGLNFEYCIDVNSLSTFGSNGMNTGGILTLTVDLPAGMTLDSVIYPNNNNWTTTSLVPGATGTITWEYNSMNVNGSLGGGAGNADTICFTVAVDNTYVPYSSIPFSLDVMCEDVMFNEVISEVFTNGDSCSCDPNDLSVMPVGCGTEGAITNAETLTYKIRFENVGPGAAHNIVIIDTLDSDLDYATLRINGSSHEITGLQITPQDELIIAFNNIELQSLEKGYVQFSVDTNAGLTDGTIITNQAGIYFDSMPPVITNEVLNTIKDNPQPMASFTYLHSSTDPNYVYDFDYTGIESTEDTYLWDFGTAATPQTSTEMDPNGIVFNSSGPHTVSLTVSRMNCSANVSTEFIAESYIDGNKVTICHKNQNTLHVNINALQAHLDHGDTVGPCGDNTRNMLSVNETNANAQFILYPNPTTGDVHINLLEETTIKLLEIHDLSGRLIENFSSQIHDSSVELNVSSLSPGMYFLRLVGEGDVIVNTNFVKQ